MSEAQLVWAQPDDADGDAALAPDRLGLDHAAALAIVLAAPSTPTTIAAVSISLTG